MKGNSCLVHISDGIIIVTSDVLQRWFGREEGRSPSARAKRPEARVARTHLPSSRSVGLLLPKMNDDEPTRQENQVVVSYRKSIESEKYKEIKGTYLRRKAEVPLPLLPDLSMCCKCECASERARDLVQ